MKKTIALFTFVASFFAASAQDIPTKAVPAVVKNAFQQQFKKTSLQEWELKDDVYNVEFYVGLSSYEAWIESTGKILKYEQDVTASQLPQGAREKIKATYAGYRIDDVDKITEGGKTVYDVEIEAGEVERKLVFDAQGGLLSDKAH